MDEPFTDILNGEHPFLTDSNFSVAFSAEGGTTWSTSNGAISPGNYEQLVESFYPRLDLGRGNIALPDQSGIDQPHPTSDPPNRDIADNFSDGPRRTGANGEGLTGACQPQEYSLSHSSFDAGTPSRRWNLMSQGYHDIAFSTEPPPSVSPSESVDLHPDDYVDNVRKVLRPNEAECPPAETQSNATRPLTIEHPLVISYLENVQTDPLLPDLIKYIVNSDWYKQKGMESLPGGEELCKAVPVRARSQSSTNSPFGAFFSRERPYICFLCTHNADNPPPNRSVERALGHARGHFRFKDKEYGDKNTAKDMKRRKGKGPTHCPTCDKPITIQNWTRHCRSKAHRQATSV